MKSIKILLLAQENSNVRHTPTHTPLNHPPPPPVPLTPPSSSSLQLQASSPTQRATCKPLRIRPSQSTGDVSSPYQSSEPRGRHLSTGAHRPCCFQLNQTIRFCQNASNNCSPGAPILPSDSTAILLLSLSGCSFLGFPFLHRVLFLFLLAITTRCLLDGSQSDYSRLLAAERWPAFGFFSPPWSRISPGGLLELESSRQ